MSYIGNTTENVNYIPAVDFFSGNASTTAFTLSRPVASYAAVQVTVANVPQNPGTAYTINGNTITFTSAPPTGSNNIYVYYTSPNLSYPTIGQDPVITGNLNFGSTGARIAGDFTNATVASRTLFQTSTTNGSTYVGAIPNGTGNNGSFSVFNSSSPANSSYVQMRITPTVSDIWSGLTGSGSYLPLTCSTGGSKRTTVDTSGNYLVGKDAIDLTNAGFSASPTEGIQVVKSGTGYGTAVWANRASGAGDGTVYEWATSGTSRGALAVSGTSTTISSNGNLYIGGGGATNFLFGTSQFYVSTAGGSASITNTSSGDQRPLYIANTSATGTPNGAFFIAMTNNPGNFDYNFIQCNANGQQRFMVYASGNAYNTNNVWAAISDARLKENIVDATPKLDKLMQVKIRSYNFKGDKTSLKQIGVVAQELEEVFPGLVDTVEEKDKDGNVVMADRKQVKYSVFVPMLIKAMQEQQAQIEELKAEVAAMKGGA